MKKKIEIKLDPNKPIHSPLATKQTFYDNIFKYLDKVQSKLQFQIITNSTFQRSKSKKRFQVQLKFQITKSKLKYTQHQNTKFISYVHS